MNNNDITKEQLIEELKELRRRFSELEEAEVERKRSEQVRLALYHIANAVNTTEDLNELFKSIQQQLGTIVDTTNFYIALYNKGDDTLLLPYFVDEKHKFTSVPAGKTLTAYIVKHNKPLLATEEDIRKMTEAGEVEMIGTISKIWLGVPLQTGKNVIGALVVQSYTDSSLYTEKDLEILKFVSDQVAIAIERKQSDEMLRESEEKYRLHFDNVSDVIFSIDPDFNLLSISPSVERVLGYRPEELIGKSLRYIDILAPDYLETAISETTRILMGVRITSSVYEFIAKDGSRKFGEVSGAPLIRDNAIVAALCVARDITERVKTEKALRASEERFRGITERSFDAIYELDLEGNITYISPAIERITGYKSKEVLGKSFNSYLRETEVPKAVQDLAKVRKGNNLEGLNLEMVRKDGSFASIEFNASPIVKDGTVVGIQGIARDITERKRVEEELRILATTDTLTGFLNRGFGLLLFGKQLQMAKRNNSKLSICYIDVDGLKDINDTYGHQEGDEVLRLISRFIKETLRKADIISRLGGDEFLLILPQCSADKAVLVWERIGEKVDAYNARKMKPYMIRLSHGFAEYDPGEEKSVDQLIAVADQEMYKDKRSKSLK